MGYAVEYLTYGRFAALTMGLSPLMSICHILYHFPILPGLHGQKLFVYLDSCHFNVHQIPSLQP